MVIETPKSERKQSIASSRPILCAVTKGGAEVIRAELGRFLKSVSEKESA